MSAQIPHSQLVGHRAELMAELFIQELNPVSVLRPTNDFGYDLLVSFANAKQGINTFAVEVKAVEKAPSKSYPIELKLFKRMAHSNLPVLLLVIDVKQNQLYYAWPGLATSAVRGDKALLDLTHLTPESKMQLRSTLLHAEPALALAK